MIIFTKHSLERMKERSIPIEEIKKAVENPEKVSRDKFGNFRFLKGYGSKVLVVVARKDGENIVVITCFKTSKVEKYLEQ